MTREGKKGTLDISQGQVGRFCANAQSFVFGEGELEFEVEENELSLSVANMVGEWAVFVPQAAGAGAEVGEGAGEGDGGGAEAAGCGQGTMCRALLDAVQRLVGGGAK